jgi:cyclic beta-1,2-glucan synthetase
MTTESQLRAAGATVAARWRLVDRSPRRAPHTAQAWHDTADALRSAARQSTPAAGLVADATQLWQEALAECRHAGTRLSRVPQVVAGRETLSRVYVLAGAYLAATGDVFAVQDFLAFADGAQDPRALQLRELWAVRPMLQLQLLERIAAAAGEDDSGQMPVLLASLRGVGDTPWREVVEALSVVERVLRQDPAGAYPRMDPESRDLCQGEVERLATRSRMAEVSVAEATLLLARDAGNRPVSDARMQARRAHVGYYLLDRGAVELRHRIGYRPPPRQWVTELVLAAPAVFYMGGVVVLSAVLVGLVQLQLGRYFATLLGALLLVPLAVQAAVEIMNGLTAFLVPPRPLAKLDFSAGIPDECATMVAVPTLLLDPEQVRTLVNELEVRFLANRDPNLHFALLTDLPDSPEPPDPGNPLVGLVAELIDGLNLKYAAEGRGSFFLFHRYGMYNPGEQAWMGWERKRGKLLDLNRLLRADQDSFPIKRGALSLLPRIAYVITLDADTQLPPGTAHRLVGTIAHPLNRAVIDPLRNIVVEGYGIIQPRVGVSVTSALRSRLASIYSGQTGIDVYTRAVSDVYQDLFREGTFTGKGICEVDVLRAVLEHRFPVNALLSHDLIEGAYARAGLASDIEIIDDYPSHYSAYNRRKHRWVRGDWQTVWWLLPRVPDYYNRSIPNPITGLSRWKIQDNLRRSTLEPLTFVLLVAGWLVLVGTATQWTLVTLALIALPPYALFGLDLLRIRRLSDIVPSVRAAFDGLVRAHAGLLLHLAFLAHQTLVLIDAVVRSLVRSVITKRKLLEWETAAQVEGDRTRRTAIDAYLDAMPLLVVLLAMTITAFSPSSLPVAAPILALWAASKPLAQWLNRAPRATGPDLSPAAWHFLRGLALETWWFFRDYGGPEHGWLVPDNVQVEPALVAYRTSPTNIGLLLNARLAALELGYLTVPEVVAASRATLEAVERLERCHGHLLNWYDTRTGAPLPPRFVSTVDSGNLAVCAWTLAAAAREMAQRPLLSPTVWQGLRDVLNQAGPAAAALRERVAVYGEDGAAWLADFPSLERTAGATGLADVQERLRAVGELVDRYAPWLSAAGREAFRDLPLPKPEEIVPQSVVNRLAGLAEGAEVELDPDVQQRLKEVRRAHQELLESFDALAHAAERLVSEMDFRPLFDPKRRLLSIGLDVERGERVATCYDLLASEARLAGFVAIAKGDVPVESWFRSGRPLVGVAGTSIVLSWSGTMFEYLMPTLWMRGYPHTLLQRSARAAVVVQERYAARQGVPWGISESAYAVRDAAGSYQYHAFGVPSLRLRLDADDRLVVAPYAACLSLGVARESAVANLFRMARLGWLGKYGFFEAADYGADGAAKGAPEIIRTWMAHHQGMSLVALANTLADAPFQRWFHASRSVQAVELLLQERVPVSVRAAAPRASKAEQRRRRLQRAIRASTTRSTTARTPVGR